jgi:hypothetical protein
MLMNHARIELKAIAWIDLKIFQRQSLQWRRNKWFEYRISGALNVRTSG